jgi:hypothetical protein
MKIDLQNSYDQFLTDIREGGAEQQHRMHRMQPLHGHLGRSLRSKLVKPMGPRTKQRLVAYSVRVKSLPLLKDTYGPSANPMVALARAATLTSALDRAERMKQGPGGVGPTPPNRRLATFGMRVELDDSYEGHQLVGGTARQRKCYRRAVARWTRT